MSRLTDLIRQAKATNPQLGLDLENEFRSLTKGRNFGLVFEKHKPEAVELPSRTIRRGDKVRVLPPRGSMERGDQRLWRVTQIERVKGGRVAHLLLIESDLEERQAVNVGDLVVVAEFRDRIYPGLVETGRVERGSDKPFHTVINSENFHALEMLTYTHRHRIDAIYIDPPYNTGAQDWKYNNDYVGPDDDYRHSKWLSFMERRLNLAKELLDPSNSVLIVTIDDKEGARLGLLLEQVFPGSRIEMVTTVINSRGKYRRGEFARCEEYVYFVALGEAKVKGEPDEDFSEGSTVPWRTLRRSDITSARGSKKGGPEQFYPLYINAEGVIVAVGEPLPYGTPRNEAPDIPGCVPVFPMRDDGTEMNWGVKAPSLRALHKHGYVRVGRSTPNKPQKYEVSYLTSGRVEDIRSGRAAVIGRNQDGSVIAKYVTHKEKMPVSTWVRASHNAEVYGTELLKSLLGEKSFPFPKALYAVEDCLRFFISDKPNAVVLDFFSGSGTTAHAVMRLNRQDGGRRQCISVTNNEVAAEEQVDLRSEGLRAGDPEWEKWGICDYITKPRIRAAITGVTPNGNPIAGDYKFQDEFPMAKGFNENAAFFTLTYEAPLSVGHNKAFSRIAPMLWLRAGSQGRLIDVIPECGWDVAESYGVLEDLDRAQEFTAAVKGSKCVKVAYVVTDDERRFQMLCAELPSDVLPLRLYESYLLNFEVNTGRGVA